jgi:HEAT repeat protein
MVAAVLALSCAASFAQSPQPTGAEQEKKLIAVLQSSAPDKEKADACRELARIGTKDAIAPLAALLPDEKLSHMARYGLETIPSPAVDEALRAAAGKLHGKLLVGVIGSIGVRRDTKAVKLLANLLHDSDNDVTQAAARALGKVGDQAAAKALLDALPSVSQANQLAFCEGLLRSAETARGPSLSTTVCVSFQRPTRSVPRPCAALSSPARKLDYRCSRRLCIATTIRWPSLPSALRRKCRVPQ